MLNRYWNKLSDDQIDKALMIWGSKEAAFREYLETIVEFESTLKDFCSIWPFHKFIDDMFESVFEEWR